MGCVGKAIRNKYKKGGAQNSQLLMPHCYHLVDQTYAQMMLEQKSQSILISGESGAGKTEAMKICLTYIGEISKPGANTKPGEDAVSDKLMQTNPVMEAIGNAKTVRNNNSSRFGKHFDIQFEEKGSILGAFTSSYLLEKPRITEHMKGERNYHVFYMVCKAAPEIREPVMVKEWQNYNICSQLGTVAEARVSPTRRPPTRSVGCPPLCTVQADATILLRPPPCRSTPLSSCRAQMTSWNDNAEFKDMHAAFLKLGFSEPQRKELYLVLSTCLQVRGSSIP